MLDQADARATVESEPATAEEPAATTVDDAAEATAEEHPTEEPPSRRMPSDPRATFAAGAIGVVTLAGLAALAARRRAEPPPLRAGEHVLLSVRPRRVVWRYAAS